MARRTVANVIRRPQLQFFEDVIKITGDGYNYKTKLKQQYIKKVHKCWILNSFSKIFVSIYYWLLQIKATEPTLYVLYEWIWFCNVNLQWNFKGRVWFW